MSDAIRKVINLVGTSLKSVAVEPLLALTPVEWSPLAAVMRAQDSLCGTANRVLVRLGLAGSSEFPVDDSLTAAAATQNYPLADTWRTIWGAFPRRQTPGTQLEAHVIYLPSGMTVHNGVNYVPDGARGGVRLLVTWNNGAESAGPEAFELDLEGSNLGGGAEPVNPGGAWTALREALIEGIRPPDSGTDTTIAEDFSEWGPGSYADATTRQHEVDIEVQIRGGARLVELVIYEVPLAHVEDHDETDPQSVHAFWAAGGPPVTPQTNVPQIEAADGPTHEEHRFGTRRLVETADWQAQRLGPSVLEACSWVSAHGPPWPVLPDPWEATDELQFVDVVTGDADYSTSRPSWIVSGAYAKPHDLTDPLQIMAGGGRGVIPVRVRVLARTDSASYGGIVRVQSGTNEWVDVTIPAGGTHPAEYSAVGYLAAQVHPDHATAYCNVLARPDRAGVTVEVRNVAVEFGAW
jgi:hypothetical protein